jgi:hypothetical protein
MHSNVTSGRVRAAIVAMEKQKILHLLRVHLQPYLSSMQRACAVLSNVARPAVQYFFTWSDKRYDIRKKKVLKTSFVLILSIKLVWNFSHSKKWARYGKKCIMDVKYPVFLSDFNETWIFSANFRKILKCQTSGKSVQRKPSFICADRRTDIQRYLTKPIDTFRYFPKASKNSSNYDTEFEMAIDLHVLYSFIFVIKLSATYIVMDVTMYLHAQIKK